MASVEEPSRGIPSADSGNGVIPSSDEIQTEEVDSINAATMNPDQDSTDGESDSSAVTNSQDQSQKDKKSTADMKAILEKLELLRENHHSVLGERFTCRRISIFVIIYCAVIAFMSCISSYLFTVSDNLVNRYKFSHFEIDFVHGADKITLVCTLLFVAYYGNKMIKPVAIMSGALIYAFGALLCALPYWYLGTRDSYKLDRIQRYLDSGLCQSGYSYSNSTNINLRSTTTNDPETFTEQCDYELSSDNQGSYTVICIAQLIMGFGKAFVLPIGVTYIEEAEKKTSTALYVGGVLLSHSFGTILGTLFGSWFISYPEDLSEDLSIMYWEVGAWWIGFPLFASILVVCALPLLIFPKWIREPRWLLYRRFRQIRREYKRQKREEEERRRRRQRKREQKRKERDRKNIHARHSGGNFTTAAGDINGEAGSETVPHLDDNIVESDADHVHVNSDSDSESETNVTTSNSNTVSNSDIAIAISDDTMDSSRDINTTSAHLVSNDRHNTNNNNDNTGATQPNSESNNNPLQQNGEAIAQIDINNPQTTSNPSTLDRRYKPKSDRKGVRIHPQDREAEKESAKPSAEDDEKEKRAAEKTARRAKLGRRLKDLPENIKYLLTEPFYTLTTLGIAASFYYVAGNQSRMPVYLVDQFQYGAEEARLITGLVFGSASLLGVLFSGLVIYKFKWSLVRQYQAVLVLSGITCLGPLISFALGCDVKYGAIERSDLGDLQPSCALDRCDCSLTQYYPVCSKGVRYYSPCHAGCNVAELEERGNKEEFVYTSCECLGRDDDAAMTHCEDSCGEGGAYVTVLFFTLLSHAMCYTSLLLIYLRAYPEKLRSLALGFAIWTTLVFAVVPGTAIYKYCHSTACEFKRENCDEDKICWRLNTDDFRNYTQTTSFLFLLAASVLFVVAYFKMDKEKLTTKAVDIGKKETPGGEENAAYEAEKATSSV